MSFPPKKIKIFSKKLLLLFHILRLFLTMQAMSVMEVLLLRHLLELIRSQCVDAMDVKTLFLLVKDKAREHIFYFTKHDALFKISSLKLF